MSLTVSGKVNVTVTADETFTLGLASQNVETQIKPAFTFSNGTGLNAINEYFSNSYTLNSGNSHATTLTLSALTDGAGRSIAFTKIRVLAVYLTTTTAGFTLTVGDAALHAWQGPLDDATATYVVNPGGLWLAVAPDAAGYAVTSGTSDQLKFASGSNDVTFQVFILGE